MKETTKLVNRFFKKREKYLKERRDILNALLKAWEESGKERTIILDNDDDFVLTFESFDDPVNETIVGITLNLTKGGVQNTLTLATEDGSEYNMNQLVEEDYATSAIISIIAEHLEEED